MKKILLSSLAALSIFLAGPSFAWDVKRMDKQINNDVYLIEFGEKGNEGICSGFDAPKQDRIVTAAHCVQSLVDQKTKKPIPDALISIQQHWRVDEKTTYDVERTAKLIAFDSNEDWAVLEAIPVEGIYHKNTAKINIETATRGEDVYVAGSPQGFINTLTKGIMSNPMRRPELLTQEGYKGVFLYQLDAPIVQGNSGGPVYNDKGEIIGIVSSIYAVRPSPMTPVEIPVGALGFAVPIKYVDKDLIQ